jgi:hypothetical protein
LGSSSVAELRAVKGAKVEGYFLSLSGKLTVYCISLNAHHIGENSQTAREILNITDTDGNYFKIVRFQVLMAAGMKMTVFLDVAPCSVVDTSRCFRGAFCLLHQEAV